ncbi:MAG: hypothetical protein P8J32_03360 [bacterium]|nr:hypothetical protein [bacterium]
MDVQMTGAYDYELDKRSGDKGEQTVIRFLEQQFKLKFVRNSEYRDGETPSDYDMLFSDTLGKDVTYEVKTDLYCKPGKDTGNIAIEHRRKGYKDETQIEETGIRKSKSHYYVYYFWNLNELWMIKTPDLRGLIHEMAQSGEIGERGTRRNKWMGDGRRSLSYLIPKAKYRDRFLVYNFSRDDL